MLSKKDQAFRLTAEFLYTLHYRSAKSNPVFSQQCKTYADLCILNVPSKYRFSRDEINIMKGSK